MAEPTDAARAADSPEDQYLAHRPWWQQWTTIVPVIALAALSVTLGRELNTIVVIVVAFLLAGAVLAAVHHAEVIAHRVGEPYGSLVLAIAVTVIEVALILTLMASGGDDASTLARDTVFAAVMITCNGIAGLALLAGALKHGTPAFNAEGTGSALATVATLATLSLVLPTFTSGAAGPRFTPAQLTFAALASLLLYVLFVINQTVKHRDFFLPVTPEGRVLDDADDAAHAVPPTSRETITSLALLVVSLIAVVGLAKAESPSIEAGESPQVVIPVAPDEALCTEMVPSGLVCQSPTVLPSGSVK